MLTFWASMFPPRMANDFVRRGSPGLTFMLVSRRTRTALLREPSTTTSTVVVL